MKKIINLEETVTFDDVLIKPAYSEVTPDKTNTFSRLSKNIDLKMPIISAAMDTVTEVPMAISMAQNGGIGVLHKNLPPEIQAFFVKRVKKHESGMVLDPICLEPDAKLKDAKKIMAEHNISGFPVTEKSKGSGLGKLVGILTNRDIRFADDDDQPIKNLMTSENLITVPHDVKKTEVEKLCHQHRIERVIIVDDKFNCQGLITVKDIENIIKFPNASKDKNGRLRVGAAVGVGEKERERIKNVYEEGVDVLVLDTAHGHSKAVIDQLKWIKANFSNADVIAGNIATREAAEILCKNNVDGIKVGIGPGSICTTRIIAGVGVPQITAILETVDVARKFDVPVIADGGLKYSGDIAKALAAGASSVMVGSLLAGTDEAPGTVFYYEGRAYKSYRGMGSIPAMTMGSKDRYFQADVNSSKKLVPEGIEGRVPYKGKVEEILYQLVGGLRSSMGYVGAKDIKEFWQKAQFIRISNASLRESHVHDVRITKESPNYPN